MTVTSEFSEDSWLATSSSSEPMSASTALSPRGRPRARKSPFTRAARASRMGSRSVSVYFASAGVVGAG